MGTRAGDHDPAIGYYMMRTEGIRPEVMDSILNRKSGVLGITGTHTDRREVPCRGAGASCPRRAGGAEAAETYV